MAPGGDLDAARAAIAAGADAIYCGLDRFNARHRAANMSFRQLGALLRLAHERDCKVYLTLNTVLLESDLEPVLALLNRLVNSSIDGVIVQDLGLLHLLASCFPTLRVHASTQLTSHNSAQLKLLGRLGVARVNLCRELSLEEVEPLARAAHERGVDVEVFVHGSYCVGLSGVCYLSAARGGSSGNRGQCSQPCRGQFEATEVGSRHPLNMVDNSALGQLEALDAAGVDALKIEGRMKGAPYVFGATRTWRRRLDAHHAGEVWDGDDGDMQKIFNRGYSSGYLTGSLERDMFSDSPRNLAARRLRRQRKLSQDEAYEEILRFGADVEQRVQATPAHRAPLTIRVTGRSGHALRATVTSPDASFEVRSEVPLAPRRDGRGSRQLEELLGRKLALLEDGEFFIQRLDLDGLEPDLALPFAALSALRKQIQAALAGGRAVVAPASMPARPTPGPVHEAPTLCVLLSSLDDLAACQEVRATQELEIHLQLPASAASARWRRLAAALESDRALVPWFPPVLMEQDLEAAADLLRRARPERLVSENSGLGQVAVDAGIPWIAGPRLNLANSLALECLAQRAGCVAAFPSPEMSQQQLRRLHPPAGMTLCMPLYRPVPLLISRQCLFHQVTGCQKVGLDAQCLPECEQRATLTDHRGDRQHLLKVPGDHCTIHHGTHLLNLELLDDLPGRYRRLLVDLSRVPTDTVCEVGTAELLRLFASAVRGDMQARHQLRRRIKPVSNDAYRRGM